MRSVFLAAAGSLGLLLAASGGAAAATADADLDTNPSATTDASPSPDGRKPDFRQLDEAATRAEACDDKVRPAYESGHNERILMALNEQAKCLEVVMFSVAREFYDRDAFGQGGVEGRFAEVRDSLSHLYETIYSEPRTCAPNCGQVYQIWAAEAYVTSIRIMLDDMIDRLKDESPYHRP
jgi:hypothetical protein